MIIAWLVCLILTVTDVFPNDPNKTGYAARTDVKINVLKESEWFRFPYPGTVKSLLLRQSFCVFCLSTNNEYQFVYVISDSTEFYRHVYQT